MTETSPIKRCSWPGDDPLYVAYHDEEWGVPVRGSQPLFEKLVLDGFQAGLSWITILRRRQNFLEAFDYFDPEKIARYDERDIERLMQDKGIIRNRLKILATIQNARLFLDMEQAHAGAFSTFLWSFTGGETLQNEWRDISQVPATSKQSEAMSKALKQKGFKFCGPTICYAFMQAVGMINDHCVDCFRYRALAHQKQEKQTGGHT